MNKKSFTLLEIIFSLVVFGIIFGVLFSLFIRIINTKTNIEARQMLVQSTYDVVEQLNTKIQNYTVDYEEYFNRTMVGCSTSAQGLTFTWDSGAQLGYCAKRTQYGNGTPLINGGAYVSAESQHKPYFCSTDIGGLTEEGGFLLGNGAGNCWLSLYSNYVLGINYATNGGRFIQPYGQYKNMFIDIKANVDSELVRAGDDDDTDLGSGSIAIVDNSRVKELYVISNDKRKRLFFRRALIATGDWNQNGTIDSDNERLYAIQMLQLKAFDAGQNHDFDALTYSGVYDGNTDTWACDFDAGYQCNGASLGGVYSGYSIPLNNNDGWINITNSNISIADWNMQIYPIKDPEFAWGEPRYQVNPYIKIYVRTTIYGENRISKVGKDNIDDITFDLQTTLNVKSNY